MNPPTLSDRVRWLRTTHGLSQAQLGKRAGIIGRSMSRIEHGGKGRGVATQTLLALAREFSVDPRWLQDGGAHGPISDADLAEWTADHPLAKRLQSPGDAADTEPALASEVIEIIAAAAAVGVSASDVLSALKEHGGATPSRELLRGMLAAFRAHSISLRPSK